MTTPVDVSSVALVFHSFSLFAMAGLGATLLFVPLFYYLEILLAEAITAALPANNRILLSASLAAERQEHIHREVQYATP